MARFVVTEKLEAKVLAAYERLRSTQKVAKHMGLGTSTVHRILKRNDVECDGLKRYRESNRKLPDAAALRAEYEAGAFLSEIAEKYGVCIQTAHQAVRASGAEMKRRGQQRRVMSDVEMKRIAELSRSGWTQTAIAHEIGTSQITVSRALRKAGIFHGARPAGSNHGAWKGGRVKTSGGYVAVKCSTDDPLWSVADSQGYVLEHRLVMARALGRALTPHETVHHINGDKTDNRLSNLQLRFGRHGKGVAMVCAKCGSHEITYRSLD